MLEHPDQETVSDYDEFNRDSESDSWDSRYRNSYRNSDSEIAEACVADHS